MRLRRIVIADPVESVARDLAQSCSRLSEQCVVATTSGQALALATTTPTDILVLSLELMDLDALEAAAARHGFSSELFVIGTYRELAAPTLTRLRKLGITDVLPQPVEVATLYTLACDRFGLSIRRHERYLVAMDVRRFDGAPFGKTVNVSEGGMRLTTNAPIAVHNSFLLDLVLPTSEHVRVRSRVLAVDGNGSTRSARLKFDNLRGRDRERFLSFVQQLPPAAPSRADAPPATAPR